jgi:hypothetical protein
MEAQDPTLTAGCKTHDSALDWKAGLFASLISRPFGVVTRAPFALATTRALTRVAPLRSRCCWIRLLESTVGVAAFPCPRLPFARGPLPSRVAVSDARLLAELSAPAIV